MAKQVTIDIRDIARELHLAVWQVQAVIELLEAGNTIPFITRYRRDRTGGLDEEQIRRIQSRLTSLRLLAERKQTILRSIENQGRLTPELEKAILEADSPSRLEDLYLPYKPKKQTLATVARSRGLQKLAEEILEADAACTDLDKRAADFVDPDKKVHHVADALAGAGHIIAEQFSERADLRETLRRMLRREALLVATAAEPPKTLQPREKEAAAAAVGASPAEAPAEKPPIAGESPTEGETPQLQKGQPPGSASYATAPAEEVGKTGEITGAVGDKEASLNAEYAGKGQSGSDVGGAAEPNLVPELSPAPEGEVPGARKPHISSQASVPTDEKEGDTAINQLHDPLPEQTPAGAELTRSLGEAGTFQGASGSVEHSPNEPDATGGNGGHAVEENGGRVHDHGNGNNDHGNGSGDGGNGNGSHLPAEDGNSQTRGVDDPVASGKVEEKAEEKSPGVSGELEASASSDPGSSSPHAPLSSGETDSPSREAAAETPCSFGEQEAPAADDRLQVSHRAEGEQSPEEILSEAFIPKVPPVPQLSAEPSAEIALTGPAAPPQISAAPERVRLGPAEHISEPPGCDPHPAEPQPVDLATVPAAVDSSIVPPEALAAETVAPQTGGPESEPPAAPQAPVAGEQAAAEAPREAGKAKKKKRKKRKKAADQSASASVATPSQTQPQKVSKAEERWRQRRAAFADYFNFRQKVDNVAPYQVLALNRGERLGVLKVKFEYDFEPFLQEAEKLCIRPDHPHADFLRGCLKDALVRLVMPALERELRRELTDKAEEHAVRVFARNLRTLLLQPPVRNRRVLAIDPGLKSGCTAVALDEFGNVLGYGDFRVIGPPAELEKGKQLLCELIDRYRIDLIAIGNGTGSRRTEPFVANLLANELKDRNIHYCIVNEAGASLYSTSPIGREEFPDYSPALRSAISIGRRLQDPLSELVKIEPAHLGVGLYQHDIQAAHLRASLAEVVESCVNYVGVDVNTASVALLRYVSGLNQLTARRIYEYRRQNGPFRNRMQLRDVPGIGEATFVQAAGFLKILDGDNPLDATWIHPESYPVAEKVLQVLGFSPQDLRSREQVEKLRAAIETVNPKELSRQLDVGELTLRDILAQLARPGRDPREDLPGPIFRQGILRLQDLKPGMALQGTVTNVVDFGVFVDFGLPITGLVHISEMSTKFVRDPHEVAEVGDIVHVWVRDVDVKRRRVALTMIPPGTSRERPPRAPAREEGQPSSTPRMPRQPAKQPQAAAPAKEAQPTSAAEATAASTGPARAAERTPGPRREERRPERPPARSAKEGTPAPGKAEEAKGPRRPRRPAKAPPVQLSEEVLSGKRPMSSFAELAQFFRIKSQLEAQKRRQTEEASKSEPSPRTSVGDTTSPAAEEPPQKPSPTTVPAVAVPVTAESGSEAPIPAPPAPLGGAEAAPEVTPAAVPTVSESASQSLTTEAASEAPEATP